ncbi:protein tweety homolog 2 isoform X3 [Pteropus vampyrus]|uniref:Protein tweety homolog n=1 Tax=Pteropus vampyrus TaxID=132908 RepID=A0A6P6CK99_PTEVA|nr:protein tweety homolog 2 isoform X3 [Pteropus vampyrus]
MLCCGLLALLLSWTSLAADTAAAVGTSDFCVAPDTFILNTTESQLSTEVTRYYLYCSQSGSSPFQQALTIFQRSLTTMQIQVAGLLQFAVPLFPTAEDYLDALAGVCYDGLEGLLFLGLFSLLAALAFSTMICAGPRAWKHLTTRDRDYDDIDDDDPFNPQARRIAAHNPPRGQLHSFCSYSSGMGSQTSLQPPAQTISNAPVSEYMYGRGSWGLPSCRVALGEMGLWAAHPGPESQEPSHALRREPTLREHAAHRERLPAPHVFSQHEGHLHVRGRRTPEALRE